MFAGEEHFYANGTWLCTGLVYVQDPTLSVAERVALMATRGRWLSCAIVDDGPGERQALALVAWAEDTPYPDDDDDGWETALRTVASVGRCAFYDGALGAPRPGPAARPPLVPELLRAAGSRSFGVCGRGRPGQHAVQYRHAAGGASAVRVLFAPPTAAEPS